jgi:GDP-D-mannose dehydratase
MLGWKPTLSFKDIVRTMVESEMALQGCTKT